MIKIDTSWKPFEIYGEAIDKLPLTNRYDGRRYIGYPGQIGFKNHDLELKFKNGKTKKYRCDLYYFNPKFGEGFWTSKYVYGQPDQPVDEFYDKFKDLEAIRPWGVEALERKINTIQIGDIVRFKGVRDTNSWREVTDIRYNEKNPFHSTCVGQKITIKGRPITTLFREAYMTENHIENAIEKLQSDGNFFKPVKI